MKKKKALQNLLENKVFVGKRTKWVKVEFMQKVKDGYVHLPIVYNDEAIAELTVKKEDGKIQFYLPSIIPTDEKD